MADHTMSKVGKALKKAIGPDGGTVRQKLDPSEVPEGDWKKGLPPAKHFLDTETGQQVPVPVRTVGTLAASDVPPALEQHVLELYGEGVPIAELERKFDLSRGYVQNALRRRFGSEEGYKAALKKLLLETGIATAQHTLANVESLHPSQSGMLAATMTNAYLAMAKHEKDTPRTVDFAALESFGEMLSRIEKYAGIAKVIPSDEEESNLKLDDSVSTEDEKLPDEE